MSARAARRQRLARVQTEFLLSTSGSCGRWELGVAAGEVGEEFDIGQGEGEAAVAFAADVGGSFAADGG